MNRQVRIILMVVAGIVAAASLAYWRLSQYPVGVAAVQPETTTTTESLAAVPAEPTGLLDDSAYAVQLRRLGVMLLATDTSVNFLFTAVEDSAVAPGDYGLIRAGDLLDSTYRVDLLGSDGAVKQVAVGDKTPVETQLRKPPSGCESAVSVPLSERADPTWVIGLRAGMAQVVPGALVNVADSTTVAEARRLTELAPMDTTAMGEGLGSPAVVFAGVPFDPQAARFTVGNAEFILVESWRRRRIDPAVAGQAAVFVVEQRLLIGERPTGSDATPFKLAWSRYAAFNVGQTSSEAPLMLLRIGPRRQPAIVFSGTYRTGGGGAIVARVGAGRWVRAVSWYTGC